MRLGFSSHVKVLQLAVSSKPTHCAASKVWPHTGYLWLKQLHALEIWSQSWYSWKSIYWPRFWGKFLHKQGRCFPHESPVTASKYSMWCKVHWRANIFSGLKDVFVLSHEQDITWLPLKPKKLRAHKQTQRTWMRVLKSKTMPGRGKSQCVPLQYGV